MIAAKESCETAWQRARGNERGITVRGLKEGEYVLLDFEIDRQLQVPIAFKSNGTFPSFPLCKAFRFRKEVEIPDPSETYVEIEVA